MKKARHSVPAVSSEEADQGAFFFFLFYSAATSKTLFKRRVMCIHVSLASVTSDI